MTGCSLLQTERRIEVQTKYIQVPPTILPEISPVTITKEPIVVMTPEEAQYLIDACNDFKAGTALEDEYNGLELNTACFWSISGYTSQGWYNFEQNLLLLGHYTERLRERIKFYEQQLQNRYEAEKDD